MQIQNTLDMRRSTLIVLLINTIPFDKRNDTFILISINVIIPSFVRQANALYALQFRTYEIIHNLSVISMPKSFCVGHFQ